MTAYGYLGPSFRRYYHPLGISSTFLWFTFVGFGTGTVEGIVMLSWLSFLRLPVPCICTVCILRIYIYVYILHICLQVWLYIWIFTRLLQKIPNTKHIEHRKHRLSANNRTEMNSVDLGRCKRIVQYLWDPEPQNDEELNTPIWCLGKEYAREIPRNSNSSKNQKSAQMTTSKTHAC